MTELLRLQHIKKEYKNQVVLSDVSLTVEEGKVYGLLGPNGAGKSTLLKIITGVIRPNAGEIFYQGKTWRQENLKAIGSIIENPAIRESMHISEIAAPKGIFGRRPRPNYAVNNVII